MHHRLRGSDRIGEERLEVGIRSRAVDQKTDVEIIGARSDGGRGVLLNEINCQRAGLHAGAVGDPGGYLVEHSLAPRNQNGVDSALGKALGKRGADAVGCAGDQRPRSVFRCERHDGCPTGATNTWMNWRRPTRHPSAVRTRLSS